MSKRLYEEVKILRTQKSLTTPHFLLKHYLESHADDFKGTAWDNGDQSTDNKKSPLW